MDGLAVGNFMAGRLTDRICVACGHLHERMDESSSGHITYVAGCWCSCVASASDYYGLNVPLDDYEPKREPLPATVGPAEPRRSGWAEWLVGLLP